MYPYVQLQVARRHILHLSKEEKLRKITFFHISKTAGLSVIENLRLSFPRRRVFPGAVDQHLALYSCKTLEQFDMFCGHMSIGYLDFLPNCLAFSILRPPIRRIVSLYRFQKAVGFSLTQDELIQAKNGTASAALSMSIDEFLSHKDGNLGTFIQNHLNNFCTCFFSTRHMNGRMSLEEGGFEIEQKTLDRAISNVEGQIHIIALDNLSRLQTLLIEEADCVPSPIPHVNQTGESLSKDKLWSYVKENSKSYSRSRDLLQNLSELDQKFYRHFLGDCHDF